jgi:hypothetical protein
MLGERLQGGFLPLRQAVSAISGLAPWPFSLGSVVGRFTCTGSLDTGEEITERAMIAQW